MKKMKKVMKVIITGCLIGAMATSLMGCNAKALVSKDTKVDVVMWNCQSSRFPNLSGQNMIRDAALAFTSKEGINVNIIVIDAPTQEAFFTKRNALMLQDDGPEILMFSTSYADEVLQIEGLADSLLPVDQYLENSDDVLKGLITKNAVAVANLAIASPVNNAVGDVYLPSYTSCIVKNEMLKTAMLKWAKESKVPFNLVDLMAYEGLFSTNLLSVTVQKVTVDKDQTLQSIKEAAEFTKVMPNKKILTKEEGVKYLIFQDKAAIKDEFSEYASNSNSRILKLNTANSINAMNSISLGQHSTKYETPVIVEDAIDFRAIGLSIVDNDSDAIEGAKAFANYLLTPEFQSKMPTLASDTGAMNGSVLKSVNQMQLEQARKEEVLANGKPIPEGMLILKESLIKALDTPDALRTMAYSSASEKFSQQFSKWVAEYVYGVHTDDAYFLEQMKQLEEDLNLMLNE